MTVTFQTGMIASVASVVVWTLVYVLMIRRGIKDRSYGMPVFALSLNIVWEGWMGFASEMAALQRGFCIVWFCFNLGVLYTVFRYGADDFTEWPILRRHFRLALCGSLLLAFGWHWAVIRGLRDTHGAYSASFNVFIYALLLVAMLLRRNSVRGQSLPILLLILIGDLLGWVVLIFGINYFQPGV
jgi:hypothetical protein